MAVDFYIAFYTSVRVAGRVEYVRGGFPSLSGEQRSSLEREYTME